MLDTQAPRPVKKIGVRHKQACIMFLGLVVAYMMRVNLSVGIVAMTDPTANPDMSIPTVNYTTEQRMVLSSMFFYGYLVSGVPAGILADKYGPVKLVAIAGGLLSGIGTLLVPFAAIHVGFWSVCTLRVIQGLTQGFFYPCINTHLSKWSLPQDRSEFTWLFTGAQIGTIVMLWVGGDLASGVRGWPSIFIYSGIAGIIWGIWCFIFGCDSPSKHTSIPVDEKHYLLSNQSSSISDDKKKLDIPWSSLLTSVPFLTLALTHMSQNWGFFILLTQMPTYIHGVYKFPISKNGFLSSLPYIGMTIFGCLQAPVALKMEGKFSRNFIRKVFNSVGYYGAALSLAAIGLFRTSAAGAITFLTMATSLNAAVYSGYQVNHMDLAPNFAGILMGITNAGSNVAAISGPTLSGFIVTEDSNESQWQIVFLISAGVYVFGNTLFLIFGSTEVQYWNDLDGNGLKESPVEDDKASSFRNAPKSQQFQQDLEDGL